MRSDRLAALILSFLLAGCGATTSSVQPVSSFTPATRPTGALIGVDARALQRQFGKPRLDIRDPTARKLQFSGSRCILDAYLYPPDKDKEPLVTFIEARSPQGTAMDANACAKALKDGR